MLGRLLGGEPPYQGIQEFRTALVETQDRPTQTTRPRRAAHVAVLAAFLYLGLCCMVPVGCSSSAGPVLGLNLPSVANPLFLRMF